VRAHKYRACLKREQKMYEVNVIYFGVQYGVAPSDRVNLVDLCDKSEYYREGEHVELLEFIGLKDCKGKDIYEGDIVQTTYDFKKEQSKAQVVIEHLTCGIRWLDPQDPSDFGFKPLYDPSNDPDDTGGLWWDLTQFEIIGNIYQNKDLLV